MSLDQARAFIEKMKSDVAFKERVLAIEDVAERLKLIKSEGFDCSQAEVKEVAGELSDTELDDVAGGGSYWTSDANSCPAFCSMFLPPRNL